MIKICRKVIGCLLIAALFLSGTMSVYASELTGSEEVGYDSLDQTSESGSESENADETENFESDIESDTSEPFTEESEETETIQDSTDETETIETEKTTASAIETESMKAEDIFSDVPKITDNGDIKSLNPGHTLTVSYKVKDSSDKTNVQWMIVDQSGKTIKVLSNKKDCLITGEASG